MIWLHFNYKHFFKILLILTGITLTSLDLPIIYLDLFLHYCILILDSCQVFLNYIYF